LIKAELNGKVINVKNSSDSKEPFIVISNPNLLEVRLQVDAYDIESIKTGNRVEIFLEQYKELITGTVKEIGSEVIKKENAFGGESPNIVEITAALDGKIPNSLKLGLEVEADIVINEHKNILVLPLESIQSEGVKTFVLCVTGKGVTTKKYIETGVSDEIHVEIKKGLSIEEKVVINGAFSAATGTTTKNLNQELIQ
jgi:HlyD family secretion protein